MRDLIDRQAATTIPILPKEHRKYQTMNIDDAYDLGWLDCQNCIEKLPPAQPEIVRCGECKHLYTEGENVVYNVCELNHNKVQPDDWFCGDAERRTDEL